VCVCMLPSADVETNITTCVSKRVSKIIAMWRLVNAEPKRLLLKENCHNASTLERCSYHVP